MKIGDLIGGKYLLKDEIGEGGMGKVFKVEHQDSLYALKICNEKDEDSIRRFKREVRLMAGIKHENVIDVLDKNFDDDIPYFVMPLCKFSIDKQLDKLQNNHELAIKVLLDVCKGINALHISGIIHRDIKPKNILISQENKIKISDLGLGKFDVRDSTILTSSNVYMGTQGFIPPEFYRKGETKNASFRSDIYQLGKTIYCVFTNSNPTLIEKDKLPGGMLYIVKKCIADNPNERYQSIGELENSLNSFLLSLKPQLNPVNAFENLINIAKENINTKSYSKDNVESIIEYLHNFTDDPETFFVKFNQIPIPLLEIISSNFSTQCLALIDVYSRTIEKHFRENRIEFTDAELVSNAMSPIFNGSKDIEVKIKAMKITLFAAVWCNRYNSMGVFDNMLKSINEDQDAIAVSLMLKENEEHYQHIADRIPSSELNHIIQHYQKVLLDRLEKEKIDKFKEFEEWE